MHMLDSVLKSCDPTCACAVCGKDGKTYSNDCEASCAKVEVAKQGACEEPSAVGECKYGSGMC